MVFEPSDRIIKSSLPMRCQCRKTCTSLQLSCRYRLILLGCLMNCRELSLQSVILLADICLQDWTKICGCKTWNSCKESSPLNSTPGLTLGRVCEQCTKWDRYMHGAVLDLIHVRGQMIIIYNQNTKSSKTILSIMGFDFDLCEFPR